MTRASAGLGVHDNGSRHEDLLFELSTDFIALASRRQNLPVLGAVNRERSSAVGLPALGSVQPSRSRAFKPVRQPARVDLVQ